MRKIEKQRHADEQRLNYTVTFPTGTTEKMVQEWLRAVSADLIPNAKDDGTTPTVVSEVRWTPKGLRHILRINPLDDGHIKQMLETHIHGTVTDPVDTPEESLRMDPVFALDVRMTDMAQHLNIAGSDALVRSILTSVPPLNEGEQVAYQVILSSASKAELPQIGNGMFGLFSGKQQPSAEDAKTYEQRASQPLLNVTIRIAVEASNEIRGRQLAGGLIKSLRQANSHRTELTGLIRNIENREVISYAYTPRNKTAQLTIPETAALIAMPIGDPHVPGLTQGAARRLSATEAISSDGEWTIGHNDIHGREKRITLPKQFVSQHIAVIGSPGTGKSVLLTNLIVQYAMAGLGIFTIDAGQDISEQRLYYRVLNAIPRNRAEDVICINPHDDPDNPVSINILDQDLGLGAISIVKGVFEAIYHDSQKGVVTVPEVLHNGLWTLIEASTDEKKYTVIDLASLLSPRNQKEWEWACELIKSVQDPELRDFWARHSEALKPLKHRDRSEWDKYVGPTHRRLWQLAGRPELRYLFGQTNSTVKIKELMEQNKILLFSVGGMDDPEAAQIASSLLTNLAWACAQQISPNQPNVMVLDEFQVSANIQGGLPDILARARALNLGLVLATQYVTREDIPRQLQSAVFNNTATRIVFRSSNREAAEWSREFGRNVYTDTDITRLQRFHAVAQVANAAGDRSPVTIKALKPAEETGLTKYVIDQSRKRYGRHVDAVRREIAERRRAVPVTVGATTEGPLNEMPYDPENWND
ncbi:type IV secretory system conjugative DNA transfer family protein [Mycolicibacterium neoaurum]|nr:hypothetical protein [Mycolicibacterium neoaurum]